MILATKQSSFLFYDSFDSNNSIQNEWGRVTTKQYLTKYFENDNELREVQDVGLDGLNAPGTPMP